MTLRGRHERTDAVATATRIKRRGPLSHHFIRAVWAAVSKQPCASVRELADMAGYSSYGLVGEALRYLRACGYIEFEDHTKRARRVVLPLREVKR